MDFPLKWKDPKAKLVMICGSPVPPEKFGRITPQLNNSLSHNHRANNSRSGDPVTHKSNKPHPEG